MQDVLRELLDLRTDGSWIVWTNADGGYDCECEDKITECEELTIEVSLELLSEISMLTKTKNIRLIFQDDIREDYHISIIIGEKDNALSSVS